MCQFPVLNAGRLCHSIPHHRIPPAYQRFSYFKHVTARSFRENKRGVGRAEVNEFFWHDICQLISIPSPARLDFLQTTHLKSQTAKRARPESAGINRHRVGDERAPHKRRSCSIVAPSHVRVAVRLYVMRLTGENAGQPLTPKSPIRDADLA